MKGRMILLAALTTCCLQAGGGVPEGMFELYARNRATNTPNYITADFLLLTHSMVLDRATAEFEERTAAPGLLALAAQLSGALSNSQGNGAEIARSYVAILGALASGKSSLEGAEANAELQRVIQAEAIERSGLLRQTIDYTQFSPRGRYTQTSTLASYFRAYRFAGAVLFPVLESRATGVTAAEADELTAAAFLLVRAIASDPDLRNRYEAMNGHLEYFFGPADDLSMADYLSHATLASKPAEARQKLFASGRRPRILGAVVDAARLEQGQTVFDVVTGFRLFPQRYSADAAAIGQIVYPHGGSYSGAAASPFTVGVINGVKVKSFPSGKELMKLLGSARAGVLLRDSGDLAYSGYAAAAAKATEELESATGLLAGHLQIVRTWLRGANEEESDRRLRAALAYWTAYRYAGVLYVKQSYTAVGKGLELPRERNGAWIEPAPELYLLLRRQVSQARRHVEHAALASWEESLDECIEAAYVTQRGAALTTHQESYLNSLDETLLPVAGKADRPIVIDVHTEPNSRQVVEEGIGFPALVTAPGGSAAGARFVHHEFKQPMAERLTDDVWIARLRAGFEANSVIASPGAAKAPAAAGPSAKLNGKIKKGRKTK